jgi:hypothetical protein
LKGFKDFNLHKGAGQGQHLALTVLCVLNSLDIMFAEFAREGTSLESEHLNTSTFHPNDLASAYLSGRGGARAEDAQGTPTLSLVLPSILVYEVYDFTSTFHPNDLDGRTFPTTLRVPLSSEEGTPQNV